MLTIGILAVANLVAVSQKISIKGSVFQLWSIILLLCRYVSKQRSNLVIQSELLQLYLALVVHWLDMAATWTLAGKTLGLCDSTTAGSEASGEVACLVYS